MIYDDLIKHWGGLSEAARALGEDRRNVHSWRTRRIPSRQQMKAESLTDGALKADHQAHLDAREMASYLPATGGAA